eukprot:jgi/Ulvmu1/7899/UM004_0131.1
MVSYLQVRREGHRYTTTTTDSSKNDAITAVTHMEQVLKEKDGMLAQIMAQKDELHEQLRIEMQRIYANEKKTKVVCVGRKNITCFCLKNSVNTPAEAPWRKYISVFHVQVRSRKHGPQR